MPDDVGQARLIAIGVVLLVGPFMIYVITKLVAYAWRMGNMKFEQDHPTEDNKQWPQHEKNRSDKTGR